MDRACRMIFLTIPLCSCQRPNDLSSPSTVSFTSISLNCGEANVFGMDVKWTAVISAAIIYMILHMQCTVHESSNAR